MIDACIISNFKLNPSIKDWLVKTQKKTTQWAVSVYFRLFKINLNYNSRILSSKISITLSLYSPPIAFLKFFLLI